MSSVSENSLLNQKELVSAVRGTVIGFAGDHSGFGFTSVATDSRNVKEGTLFVPLMGEKQNGHNYIPQAIEAGASVVFIKRSEYEANTNMYMGMAAQHINVTFITVINTLTALQDAAAAYVEKFPSLIKVAITGSSGKTTSKEMVVSILKQKYNVVYTQGNFNSETGLPLSVFNIRPEHQVGVFEMGMNRVNEIGEISSVLKAKYALVTNVGTAHIGILGSRKNIAIEKRKIFNYIPEDGIAFIPDGDDFKDFIGERVTGKKVYFGENVSEQESGAKFIEDKGLEGTVFSLDGVEINLKNAGIYNYRNALGACAVGKALAVTPEQIKAGLEGLGAVSGRMEIKQISLKNEMKVSLIKDCYNANPDSMKSVIDFCSTVEEVNKKILILGDMLELGEKSKEEHKAVCQHAVSANPDLLILIGKEMKSGFDYCNEVSFGKAAYFEGHDENIIKKVSELVLDKAEEKDLILVKASRGIALERVIDMISKGEQK